MFRFLSSIPWLRSCFSCPFDFWLIPARLVPCSAHKIRGYVFLVNISPVNDVLLFPLDLLPFFCFVSCLLLCFTKADMIYVFGGLYLLFLNSFIDSHSLCFFGSALRFPNHWSWMTAYRLRCYVFIGPSSLFFVFSLLFCCLYYRRSLPICQALFEIIFCYFIIVFILCIFQTFYTLSHYFLLIFLLYPAKMSQGTNGHKMDACIHFYVYGDR